jgi:hypothetical protein
MGRRIIKTDGPRRDLARLRTVAIVAVLVAIVLVGVFLVVMRSTAAGH